MLRKYNGKLSGIVNGIDTSVYNPETDSYITAQYDADSLYEKSKINARCSVILVCQKRRNADYFNGNEINEAKGLDLVRTVFREIMEEDVQCIILGSGDSEYEKFFEWMAYEYPEKVKVYIGFNEELAHQVYAGSDLFLMPSLFEPCGLGQLIALAYGTIQL